MANWSRCIHRLRSHRQSIWGANYDSRAPLALDAIELLADGRVRVRTPHHPQTGATRMEFDALEMIRRLCAQIPDARRKRPFPGAFPDAS